MLKLLNLDFSNFSVGVTKMLENSISTLVAFEALITIREKSLYWITDEMCKRLTALDDKQDVL